MANEIELKLELARSIAPADLATALALETGTSKSTHAVYFDTPDNLLAREGISLRVRAQGETRTQTIKRTRSGGAGYFDRDEWETALAGHLPIVDDLEALGIGADARATIAAVFTVDVDRTKWTIAQDDALIEMVLDIGAVRMPGRLAPINEIELELVSGSPAALFALALRLDAAIPVRPGVLTKAARGYRLSNAAVGAVKADPVALESAMTAEQALSAIAANCLTQYRLNEEIVLSHRSPEALHQARVGLRRLRSALSIGKAMANDAEAPRIRGELKWLAGVLGRARDLDVMGARLTGEDRAVIEAAALRAYDEVVETLNSDRARQGLIGLSAWLATGDWRTAQDTATARAQTASAFAARTLERLDKTLTKHGKRLAKGPDAARHAVRKLAKKMRYGAEFFGPLFTGKTARKRRARLLERIETVQDRLGDLNDRVAAPERAQRYGLGEDFQSRMELAGKSQLIKASVKAFADLADEKRFWR